MGQSQAHGFLADLDKASLRHLQGLGCAESATYACDRCSSFTDFGNVDADAAANVKHLRNERNLPPIRREEDTVADEPDPQTPTLYHKGKIDAASSREDTDGVVSPPGFTETSQGGLEGVQADEEATDGVPERKVVKAEIIAGTFIVVIDTMDNPKGILGVHAALARVQGHEGLIIKSVSEGLIRQWNKKHEGQELKAGDVIIEVNGIKGNGKELHQLLIRVMDLKIALKMVVLREAEMNRKEENYPYVPPKTKKGDKPANPVPGAKAKAKASTKKSAEGDKLFAEAMKHNSGGSGLHVGFQLPDGDAKVVTFDKRPLGLDFEKKCPIIIKRVARGRPGEQLGIKPGWEIVSMNGVNVVGKDFPSVYQMFQQLAATLPKMEVASDKQDIKNKDK